MQKYRKFLVLLALAVTGCGAAKNTAEKTADTSAASVQADQEPSDMIFLNNTMYACPYYQSDDEYRIVRKQI